MRTVAVVGPESTGKTALVRSLAQLYGTEWVAEQGRAYCDRLGSYDTIPSDFATIAIERARRRARRVLFIDTDAHATQNFSREYHGVTDPAVQAIADRQDFDLALFCEPDIVWIDDGIRSIGAQEAREATSGRLRDAIASAGVPVTTISGSHDERLLQAMAAVDRMESGSSL